MKSRNIIYYYYYYYNCFTFIVDDLSVMDVQLVKEVMLEENWKWTVYYFDFETMISKDGKPKVDLAICQMTDSEPHVFSRLDAVE